MRRHISVLAVLLFVLVISMSIGFDEEDQTTLEKYLDSYEIEMNSSESFNIRTKEESTVAGVRMHQATAAKGDQVIEIKLIEEASYDFAESYLQSKNQEITSMYSDTPAPYKAVPERKVDCKEQFLPNITQAQSKKNNYTYYSLYSDGNRNLGECSAEEVMYEVDIVKVYCSNQETILELRQYSPVNHQNKSSVVESIQCR